MRWDPQPQDGQRVDQKSSWGGMQTPQEVLGELKRISATFEQWCAPVVGYSEYNNRIESTFVVQTLATFFNHL